MHAAAGLHARLPAPLGIEQYLGQPQQHGGVPQQYGGLPQQSYTREDGAGIMNMKEAASDFSLASASQSRESPAHRRRTRLLRP